MKPWLISVVMAFATAGAALAQSSPGLVNGQIPTAAQWNSYFAAKQDWPPSGGSGAAVVETDMAALAAMTRAQMLAAGTVLLQGYYSGSTLGGGTFIWYTVAPGFVPDGGTVVPHQIILAISSNKWR